MDSTQRKGINFDLDTEALKEHYPKGDWHNAYYDVRAYLERNGFEHIQESGYHSVEIMTEDTLIAEYTINYKKTHSQTLLPMIDEICRMTETDVSDIDIVAVSDGPG